MPPHLGVFVDLCLNIRPVCPNFLLSICNFKVNISKIRFIIFHPPNLFLRHSCVPFLCKQHHLSPSCSCREFRSHAWFNFSSLLFRSSELVNFITLIGLKSTFFVHSHCYHTDADRCESRIGIKKFSPTCPTRFSPRDWHNRCGGNVG